MAEAIKLSCQNLVKNKRGSAVLFVYINGTKVHTDHHNGVSISCTSLPNSHNTTICTNYQVNGGIYDSVSPPTFNAHYMSNTPLHFTEGLRNSSDSMDIDLTDNVVTQDKQDSTRAYPFTKISTTTSDSHTDNRYPSNSRYVDNILEGQHLKQEEEENETNATYLLTGSFKNMSTIIKYIVGKICKENGLYDHIDQTNIPYIVEDKSVDDPMITIDDEYNNNSTETNHPESFQNSHDTNKFYYSHHLQEQQQQQQYYKDASTNDSSDKQLDPILLLPSTDPIIIKKACEKLVESHKDAGVLFVYIPPPNLSTPQTAYSTTGVISHTTGIFLHKVDEQEPPVKIRKSLFREQPVAKESKHIPESYNFTDSEQDKHTCLIYGVFERLVPTVEIIIGHVGGNNHNSFIHTSSIMQIIHY